MRAKVFVDSNTLLYLHERNEPQKLERSRHWLKILTDADGAVTNLQVLNEVTNVFLKRMRDWETEYVFSVIDEFSSLGATPITQAEVHAARQIRIRTRYSWWDCILLASALELGCTHFLSEDLQDGQVITDSAARRLTIVDPFVHSPEQILPN